MPRLRECVIVLIIGAVLSGCLTVGDIRSASGTQTTLIILRHAERPLLGTELTKQGRARAAALPAALQGIRIDAIYSPRLSRNLDTVAPLAKERGLKVTVMEIGWTENLAIQLIHGNPGKTVLWVGNHDNLEETYKDIGAEGKPPLDYGDLHIVDIPDKGPLKVTRSHYGQ